MPSLKPVSMPKIINDNIQGLWTFIFFVLLLAIFFAYDDVMSLMPTTQAKPVILYPGDTNWDNRFVTGDLDNSADVLAVDGSNLFVGGNFNYAGTANMKKIGYWDGAAWQEMDGGINQYGSVDAITVSGDNVFVGGYFTSVGANPVISAKNIAVWSKTAKRWSSLQGGMNGQVTILATNGTDVFAAGNFQTAGGRATNGLARWNIRDAAWYAFGDLPYSGAVQYMAVDGQNVYISGYFSEVGGQPVNNVAYWDGITWNPMGSNDSQLEHLTARNGEVYTVAKTYMGYGDSIVVKHWDGSDWVNLGDSMLGNAIDLAISPNGTPVLAFEEWETGRRGIYQWNALDNRFDLMVETPNSAIRQMVYQGTDLVLSGNFQNLGSACGTNLIRWDSSSWAPIGSRTSTVNSSTLSVVGPSENNLYFGGNFSCANEAAAELVTHWNGTALESVGDGLTGSFARLVWDNSSNRLYAAGSFTADSNPAVRNIGYLENGAWKPLGSVIEEAGYGVNAISVSGNSVAIAYTLTNGGNQVYLLQNGNWQPAGAPIQGSVYALAIIGQDVYVGGSFWSIGATNLTNIARWDGISWNPVGYGVESPVYTLAVMGSDLLVGGEFSEINGDSTLGRIARWDGTSWHGIGNIDATRVHKITVYGNQIYAAHESWNPDENISRWDGTSWVRIGHVSGDGMYAGKGLVEDMGIYNGSIFVGGSFTSAGNIQSRYIAWWHSMNVFLPALVR